MKTSLLLVAIFSLSYSFNQVIDSISISPTNPTTEDTIWIYVSSTFTSGDCQGSSEISIIDNIINSSSTHCIGMLTVICHDVDTFKINPLPEGNFHFFHTLSSGFGPIPCTPGIVADDSDTLIFTVEKKLDINKNDIENITISPNPITQNSFLKINNNKINIEKIEIFDATLRKVYSNRIFESNLLKSIELDLNQLNKGVYFIQLILKDNLKSKLIKVVKE